MQDLLLIILPPPQVALHGVATLDHGDHPPLIVGILLRSLLFIDLFIRRGLFSDSLLMIGLAYDSRLSISW